MLQSKMPSRITLQNEAVVQLRKSLVAGGMQNSALVAQVDGQNKTPESLPTALILDRKKARSGVARAAGEEADMAPRGWASPGEWMLAASRSLLFSILLRIQLVSFSKLESLIQKKGKIMLVWLLISL